MPKVIKNFFIPKSSIKIFNLNGDIAEVRRKFSELLTITINH